MAVTNQQLYEAIRAGAGAPVGTALDDMNRLLAYCNAAVERYASVAPEAVKDMAVIQLGQYLYDAPIAARRNASNALSESGVRAILAPYRRLTATLIDPVSGEPRRVVIADGGVAVFEWAHEGDASMIPADKLGLRPGPTRKEVYDLITAIVMAGANVTLTPDASANSLSIAATGGGGGSGLTPDQSRHIAKAVQVAQVTLSADDLVFMSEDGTTTTIDLAPAINPLIQSWARSTAQPSDLEAQVRVLPSIVDLREFESAFTEDTTVVDGKALNIATVNQWTDMDYTVESLTPDAELTVTVKATGEPDGQVRFDLSALEEKIRIAVQHGGEIVDSTRGILFRNPPDNNRYYVGMKADRSLYFAADTADNYTINIDVHEHNATPFVVAADLDGINDVIDPRIESFARAGSREFFPTDRLPISVRGLANRNIAGLAIVGNRAVEQRLTGFPLGAFNLNAQANRTGEFHITLQVGITGRSDVTLGLGGPRVENNVIQAFLFSSVLRNAPAWVLGGATEGVKVGELDVISLPVNRQGRPTGPPKTQGTVEFWFGRTPEAAGATNAGYLLKYVPASNGDSDKTFNITGRLSMSFTASDSAVGQASEFSLVGPLWASTARDLLTTNPAENENLVDPGSGGWTISSAGRTAGLFTKTSPSPDSREVIFPLNPPTTFIDSIWITSRTSAGNISRVRIPWGGFFNRDGNIYVTTIPLNIRRAPIRAALVQMGHNPTSALTFFKILQSRARGSLNSGVFVDIHPGGFFGTFG